MMKIKRLNFIKKYGCYEAITSLGIYCINSVNLLCIMNNDGASWTEHETLEGAEEHAQRDFEQRIMAYIENDLS